jgi:hypothetical protein
MEKKCLRCSTPLTVEDNDSDYCNTCLDDFIDELDEIVNVDEGKE